MALKELLDSYEKVKGTPVTLGRTGIIVNKNGFGALPIQRIGKEEAALLLRKAFDAGVRYFDTARAYSDSEEKIGYALSDVRDQIFIATKTMADTPEKFWKDLEESLLKLKTDYIDIYQFHNPPVCPKPGDETGLYDAMLEAKKQGKIRFIGITNHRIDVAEEAVQLCDRFPCIRDFRPADTLLHGVSHRDHFGRRRHRFRRYFQAGQANDRTGHRRDHPGSLLHRFRHRRIPLYPGGLRIYEGPGKRRHVQ